MRPVVALLALAVLAATAPLTALGDPGGEHGRGGGWREGGGWRGGPERGGPERGGPERGGPERGAAPYEAYGGGWRGGPPDRRGPVPWAGRDAGPEGGPPDAEPPRGGRYGNSLGRDYREQQDEARQGVRRGWHSMQQVMQNIRRRTPGRPLDAGLEQWRDGRPVYRVRWAAADGRRIDYIIDAQTGYILEEER